jgi:hypothetical protein
MVGRAPVRFPRYAVFGLTLGMFSLLLWRTLPIVAAQAWQPLDRHDPSQPEAELWLRRVFRDASIVHLVAFSLDVLSFLASRGRTVKSAVMRLLSLIHAVTGASYFAMSLMRPSRSVPLMMYPLRNLEWAVSLPLLVRMLGELCSVPPDIWFDPAMLQARRHHLETVDHRVRMLSSSRNPQRRRDESPPHHARRAARQALTISLGSLSWWHFRHFAPLAVLGGVGASLAYAWSVGLLWEVRN